MLRLLSRLWTDQVGLVTVEYALLLSLIVVGSISAWASLGAKVCHIVEVALDEFPSP